MDFSSQLFHALFPSVVFAANSESVYLTFDDGPHPTATPRILEILERHNITATFFLVGEHVLQFPTIAKNIVAERHCVGNHSHSHVNVLLHSKEVIRHEIMIANDAIAQTTGVIPTLFRPPYGYYDFRTLRIVQSLGMRLVHWSIDTRDFQDGTDLDRISKCTGKVEHGSILLLHDNESVADKVGRMLPTLIEGLKSRGFTFASLH